MVDMLSPAPPAGTPVAEAPSAGARAAGAPAAEAQLAAVSLTAVAGENAARYSWLLCSAVLLLAVCAERWLLSLHVFPGDTWAAQIGMSHKSWPVWDLTRIYQQVGRPLVAIGEVAVILAWLWRSAGRRELQGLFIVLLASVMCGVIKILCGPTPLWMVLNHHVGTNFPSGVVTFMTATVGYVAMVAWRLGRRLVPIALVVAIVGAGPARVIGGQHLISDVLGAYMLGTAWLLIAYTYLVTPVRRAQRHATWAVPSLETLD